MQTQTLTWTQAQGWKTAGGDALDAGSVQLVIYFAAPGLMESGERFNEIRERFPNADLIGCSTGGEIVDDEVLDGSIVVAAVKFEKTQVQAVQFSVEENSSSEAIGEQIGKMLQQEGLRNIFILSDGLHIVGSDLVTGITRHTADDVVITGGLAGDGADFQKTIVGLNQPPKEKNVAAIGFYGDAVIAGYGSAGGWDSFGPERIITKSDNNILYELDDQPALDLYKSYLGEEADKLPGSGLLFPLSIRPDRESEHDIVRTIVGIDEAAKSLIFAGDIPQGYTAKLMKGNFDNLVDGAVEAAEMAKAGLAGFKGTPLAIMVSCIGRNLLMGQRISDEIESVKDRYGEGIETVGFYSYGEICPHGKTRQCGLHNQTMTITLLAEKS